MSSQGPTVPRSASAPPPSPPPVAPAASNRNLMVVLSYLWLLALIPLLTEKGDKEVQWHAKHGLVLTVAEFALWLVLHLVTRLLIVATAGLGCFVVLLFPLIGLAILALHIICIVKGVNGQRFVIPGLSDFADKF